MTTNSSLTSPIKTSEESKVDIGIFSTASHPIACLFHLLFKGAAIFRYFSNLYTFSFLFLNLFIGNEIVTFVVILVLSAMDFWTVKNITGRILVNLRWWSDIDEVGNEKWVFESNDDPERKREIGATDSFVFWAGLYLTPVAWGLFAFMDFIGFKFFWMYVCIMGFILSFTNTMAFYQCQKDHQSKVRSYIQEKTMSYVFGGAASSAFGGLKDLAVSRLPFFGNRS